MNGVQTSANCDSASFRFGLLTVPTTRQPTTDHPRRRPSQARQRELRDPLDQLRPRTQVLTYLYKSITWGPPWQCATRGPQPVRVTGGNRLFVHVRPSLKERNVPNE